MRRRETLPELAARCRDDFPAFAYDGWGVMLSDGQLAADREMGQLGPRGHRDPKIHFLSGGQRSGKTVFLGLKHADACLYKRGVDNTDRRFWLNYNYRTLAIAPSVELTLKLYIVMDELAKGASDAQWDRRFRRSRGGRMIGLLRMGRSDKWPTAFFEGGAQTDFRSSEGRATRLEGGQWWGATWDEWATQPSHEIPYVLEEVLLGRTRDHDGRIWAAAWPKEGTEHHLTKVEREIETGANEGIRDVRKAITYVSAETAHFTNQEALAIERGMKDDAKYRRTVLGRPAGGAAIEFKRDLLMNMVIPSLPRQSLPDDDPPDGAHRYLCSWDLGLAHDETVGIAWRIPRGGVTTGSRARIKEVRILRSGAGQTLDVITHEIAMMQRAYRGADVALDAASLGGLAAYRQLRILKPPPIAFTATAHHRVYGNLRLAAITNALEMLAWDRHPDTQEAPWGLIECPDLPDLIDQMAYFDRDAKDRDDDRVWAFLIGCWYIRRYWVVGEQHHRHAVFDARMMRDRRAVPFLAR